MKTAIDARGVDIYQMPGTRRRQRTLIAGVDSSMTGVRVEAWGADVRVFVLLGGKGAKREGKQFELAIGLAELEGLAAIGRDYRDQITRWMRVRSQAEDDASGLGQ